MRVACLPTGPDEYAAAVIRALATEADILVLAPSAWIERYAADLPETVQLCPLPWPRHRDPRSLLLVWRVLRRLAAFRPDVVHFLGDSIVWLALALPWLRRRPLVVTVHDVKMHPGDTQTQRVPTTTVDLLRRAADAVIVHGDGLARELAATGVRPPAGIHAVAHPVLDRHRRLAAAPGSRAALPGSGVGPRLLFFGRVMAYKGLAVLLAAADRLIERYPSLVVTVAGRGPELDRLRPELDRRPWFVVHDTYVPDAEVAGLFHATDLLVLPYIEASQSGVAALAAAFGTPVVASDVGELGEVVRATGMGVVVPPDDSVALAGAIGQLIEAPERRAACAAAARAAAEGPMAPAAVAARTLEVYAAARRRPAR
jgi:glycosyltransferase involved in cell wall biosynthesis